MADNDYKPEDDWTFADKLADRIAKGFTGAVGGTLKAFATIGEKLASVVTKAGGLVGVGKGDRSEYDPKRDAGKPGDVAAAFGAIIDKLSGGRAEEAKPPVQDLKYWSQLQKIPTAFVGAGGGPTSGAQSQQSAAPLQQSIMQPFWNGLKNFLGSSQQQGPPSYQQQGGQQTATTFMGMPVANNQYSGPGTTKVPILKPADDRQSQKQDAGLNKLIEALGGGRYQSAIQKAQGGDYKEIAEIAKEKIKDKFQSFSRGFDALANSRTGSDPGAFMTAGKEMSKMVPILGKVGEGFFKVGEKLFSAKDKLDQWTQKLHESDLRFAQWSGSMARVMMEAEVRDIRLAHQRGERRAASARAREESAFRAREAWAPLEDDLASAAGYINTGFQEVKGLLGNFYNWATGRFGTSQEASSPSMADWLQSISNDRSSDANFNVPNRHRERQF